MTWICHPIISIPEVIAMSESRTPILSTLSPPRGSVKRRKRVGRGPGCHGKTSGRGHKGQNARSGGGVSPWFEGGQTPLKMRVPKRGFTNVFRQEYDIVNLDQLRRFEPDEEVTPERLHEAGLVSGKAPVKVLGRGDLERPLVVRAHKFSRSAVAKIEGKGGKAEVL